tara:strand:+ start:15363 stop:15587 length:225 start_codon:yes stop_codon:yes gene_type:complete
MTKPVTPQPGELAQALADLDGHVVKLERLVALITDSASRGGPPRPLQSVTGGGVVIRPRWTPRFHLITGGQAHA